MDLRSLWRTMTRWRRSRSSPAAEQTEELLCAVCGAPATTWEYRSFTRDGQQVVDGVAVCSAHGRSRTRDLAG